MIRHHPESDIDFFLFGEIRARAGQRASVRFAAQVRDSLEDRPEDIALVIGDWAIEIPEIVGAFDNAGDPFEAESGVHMSGGQRRVSAVRIGIELDKDQIPDFHA